MADVSLRPLFLRILLLLILLGSPAFALEPIPEKLVVLTFDDSVASHYEVVRPLLKKYKFGATFFITEGFTFPTDKKLYLTWKEIARLHKDGFEIGNHTRDHTPVDDEQLIALKKQLASVDANCQSNGIPRPTSFAWPGNMINEKALVILRDAGIRFARRGGSPEYPYEGGKGFAYDPKADHPLLIPSAGDARPDWAFADFENALLKARNGRIVVLQFHGVPDKDHPAVSTSRAQFQKYLRYLHREKYRVIAMRDLSRFVDHTLWPAIPMHIIETRQSQVEELDKKPVSPR